ncbi:MAG: hypothetical protein Q4E99_01670 [Bacillota bacterium]|nr:hypothetical protein [Bacillota bacterium]
MKCIKTQSKKTLFNNINLIKDKLGELCYAKEKSDLELVSDINDFLINNPGDYDRKRFDRAITDLVYKDRTVQEEMVYQERRVKGLCGRAVEIGDWGMIVKGIAKLQVLKSMPKDEVINVADLDAKSIEYLANHPNILLNASMRNLAVVKSYFDNPDDFINNFYYEKPKPIQVDLNSAYNEFRQKLIKKFGEKEFKSLDKEVGPLDSLDKKAMEIASFETRIAPGDDIMKLMLIAANNPEYRGWDRIFSYYMVTPKTPEDEKKNCEFAINIVQNKIQPNGLTFRQDTIRKTVDRILNLDMGELANLSDDQILYDWQHIYNTWGPAFVCLNDLLPVCEGEGIKITEKEKAALHYLNGLATVLYTQVQSRRDQLCNPYTPLAKGVSSEYLKSLEDMSFDSKFLGVQFRGFMSTELRMQRDPRINALSKVGLGKYSGIADSKIYLYDDNGAATEAKDNIDVLLDTQQTFSVKKPSGEAVFYRFDGKDAFIVGESFNQIKEYLKPHDVTVHIDSNKEYTDEQYLEAFGDAYEQLVDKIANGANITTRDIARSIVMQDINNKLRDHMNDDDEYHMALQAFVDNEYIEASIDAVIANPAFDKLIEKMGGLDEQQFIKKQHQNEYVSTKAFEDYQAINASLMDGKQLDWDKPLDEKASLEKIEEYKAILKEEHGSLRKGQENSAHFRCKENVFRIALLQKNIDENLGMSLKDIENRANLLAFSPKYASISESSLADKNVKSAVDNILEPNPDEYSWSRRIYKLVDRCEEIRKPDFEKEDQFIERKLKESGITDEKQVETAKKEFARMAMANNLVRFGNPDKAMTNEELWSMQNDSDLIHSHKIAEEQNKQLIDNAVLRQESIGAKDYLNRSFFHNVKNNPEGTEKIVEEKAKILLKGNTGEALQFQKEYITSMINKMLALPDDKLAQKGTDESRQYFTEHYNEICMLFEVENFMGGPSLEHGVRDDFIIPQEVVDVLRHKKNLLQENILGDEGYINTKGKENYHIYDIMSKVENNELQWMQSVEGDFSADKDIVEVGPKIIASRVGESQSIENVKPDKKYDGLQLNLSDVKIKARFEDAKTLDEFVEEYTTKVDKSQVTINTNLENLENEIEHTKATYKSAKNEQERADALNKLKVSCDTYTKSMVPPWKSISSLSPADQECVKFVSQMSAFCKDKAAYHMMKGKVNKLETELGVKDHSLDIAINPDVLYDMESYKNFISTNRAKVVEAINGKISKQEPVSADLIARLVVLDGVGNQIRQENYSAEYTQTFLSEDFIQQNIEDVKSTPQFKNLVSNNPDLSGDFLESDLSQKFVEESVDMQEELDAIKIEDEKKKLEKSEKELAKSVQDLGALE